MIGDVNGNGQVSVLDVIKVVNSILEIHPPPTEDELWAADCDSNKSVDILDTVGIVRLLLGQRSGRKK